MVNDSRFDFRLFVLYIDARFEFRNEKYEEEEEEEEEEDRRRKTKEEEEEESEHAGNCEILNCH